MAITVEQTTAEVQAFFQDLRTAAQNQIAQQNLPLIGAVPAIPTGALFQALELEVTGALAALDRGASAADIAVALRAIEIDGMHPISAHDSGDGIDITIAKEVGLHLTEKPFDLGGTVAGVGLELDGEFATKLTADLDVKLRLDSSGQLQVRDSTNPELAVGLDASLSLEGEGKLGFLTIKAKDKDPNQPEVELDLGIDLASGDAGGLVATAAPPTVRAGLDLQIEAGVGVDTDEETGIPFSILPSISTELVIDYSAIDDTTPSIAFNDITVDVRSIYGILQQVLEPIAEILDTEPLGTVLDLATGPVPILDDLAPFLDTLPSLTNGDSVVSLADIAVWQSKLQGADPNVFLEIVSLLDLIRDLGLPSENQEMGAIVLGSIAFSAATNPTDLKSVFTSAVGDSGLDELDGFLNISGFLDDSLDDDVSEQFSAIPGLEIPLLKNPSEIVGLLFNEVYESVTLVTYDLPELKVEGGFSLSIPIFPPIALKFTGNAGASIDLKIGYDTKAFEEAVAGAPFAFEDGFFFDAAKPLASLTAELTASAGFDALVLSAWATGGIHFAISASLDNKDGDGKVRLGELGGCFVDPITGKAWADVTVDIEIYFGLFSVSESIPIASVTLAEFDLFKCPPPRMPTSPPNQGLATVGAFGVPPELVLNVGDRASERVVTEDGESKQIPGENEFYFIGLAREPATNEGPFPSTQVPGAIIPDAIDVSAFGYTQRYGSAAAPVTSIRANFGSQNDSLVIAEEITLESHISGGEGNDFMSGGSGRDLFSGDNGEDYLVGKKGDDVLEGGARNDTLDGGEGADAFRGGTGRDKVTYANANKTTGDGVTIFWDESAGKLTAKGGEANGDTFDSIEYLLGTSFNDTLVGNPFLFLTGLDLYNTLEGGDGSDLLIGAEVTGDFLIGGRGGDTIDGKSGIDGTTYVTSVGGVYIDLGARVFLLGDAEGDNLISIENVQGSSSNDTIYGDGANNEIDGFIGDDWLSGGGGTDKVSGHLGNDTIFGFGDGDTLDGGGSANAPGVDLLTYRVYTGGPVTVNLRTGQATRAGGSDTIAMAKWDVNPPVLANGTSTFENLEGTNLPGTGDSLTGDDSYNTVWGLAGNDIINGGFGNDTLVGGAGADALNGGSGVDLADYRGSPGGVRVDLLAGTGTDSDADGDRLTGIENLRGSDHTDRLIGNDSVNEIDPGLSDTNARDDVDGKGGTDTLFLDYSRGQSGKGLIGGIGFAKASSVSTGSTDTGVFYREFRTTTNELDGVSFTGIERLHVIGTSKADEIYGGQDDDIINTGKGNDVIVSGLGSDYVDAGAGNDSVSYGTGANWQLTHRGGAKEFKLFGGRGIDTLSVSLAQATSNIVLTGSAPGVENPDVNGTLANGSAIAQFEILRDIWTGDGDDTIIQSGSYDNNFRTGWGVDVITPGLGHDIVDGGFDFRFGVEVFQGESDGLPPISIVDREAFDRNPGDLLMLDYSSLAGTGVSGTANQVVSTLHIDAGETTVFTNEGTYEPTTPVPAFGGLTFTEIERINVKGTNQDDLLVGTDISGDDIVASLRGDDRLEGLDGDDVLVGYFGDDTLLGGAGHDILIGTYASEIPASDVDVLTGGADEDVFVLGDAEFAGYAAFENSDYAVITDFNPTEGDIIQLWAVSNDHGSSFSYRTEIDETSTLLFLDVSGGAGGGGLFAKIENFSGFELDASYVTYVDENNPGVGRAAGSAIARTLAATDPPPDEGTPPAEPSGSELIQPLTTLNGFTLAEENDPDALLAALGANSGIVADSASITVEGADETVGTFNGDPFGLGSGIVISTGSVEDLVGPNTDSGSATPTISIPVEFVRIGRVGATDVYKADLSNLGIDIRSLTLNDSNVRIFGGGDSSSGFDLDFVKLSQTELTNVDGMTADQINGLSELDVFDLNAAAIEFRPGTQRNEIPGLALSGSAGDGIIIDASHLGILDADGITDKGNLTLGDGGHIGFNLNQALSTDGPLFLYIGEDGAAGETVQGLITVSSAALEPPGDLSTDLAGTGREDDTTTLTYKFTPVVGADTIQFQFVLFSEELPEFAGTFPTDTFKIKLNGVDYAALSDGSAATLNNLMVTTSGPTHPDLILNSPGTGPASDLTRADAYTTVITFTGQATAGVENVLEFEVADGRDAFLDSGILIKAGSISAGSGHAMSVTGGGAGGSGGTLTEGGAPGSITVTPPAGHDGSCTVHLIPSNNLDLGIGSGVPVDVVFGAGDSTPRQIAVRAIAGDGPPAPGRIDVEVECDDPAIDGTVIPPVAFEITEPTNLPPDITSGVTFTVKENAVAIGTVTATDPDIGQSVAYAIVGGADKSLFQINTGTGELSFVAAPDFEKPGDSGGDNVYDVVVKASDNGNPVLSDEQAIAVRVTNVAESFVPHGTGFFDADHSGGYLLRKGDGTFFLEDVNSNQVTGHLVGAVGIEWRFIGNGDFNGNDVSDMLSVRDSDNMLHVHTMGSNQVVGAGFVGQVGGEWNILGIGDFNDDGTDDILSQRDSDGMIHVHQMNSTQVSGSAFLGQIGTEWNFLATGDFNNDGTSDLLWQHDSNGQVLIHNIQSNQVVGSALVGQIGSEWHFAGSGDFDGDHTDDVLWQADNGTLLVYDINNNQVTNAPMLETLPADMDVAGIGDFTGDGTDDLVLRHDDGSFQLQQIQNNVVTSTANLGQVGNEWFII